MWEAFLQRLSVILNSAWRESWGKDGKMEAERLVSVIIPVYNTEKYLKKCVDSVRNQTYQNLEIWLVDDGSTDSSGAICDEYAQMDTRISVIHKANGGLSDARNAALDQISGEYIAFIDSDDWISENWVSELVAAAIKYNAEIAVGGVCGYSCGRYIYSTLCCPNTVLEKPEQMIQYICSTDLRPTVTNKLYLADLFAELRFPYGRIHEDAFVSHILLGASKKAAIVEGCFYYVRVREGSITQQGISGKRIADAHQASEEMLMYYKSNYPELEKLATQKYINEQFGLLRLIYSTKDPNLFDNQIKMLDAMLTAQMNRLSELEGEKYDYQLSEGINTYLYDKQRFRSECVMHQKKTQIKGIIKKLVSLILPSVMV